MCSAGRPGNYIRFRLCRTAPGVKRMADDSPAPPLTRRVPGAARGGPGSSVRPVLPDALLKRMQAAVDAARAGQSEQTDRAAFAKTHGAAPQPDAPRTARPEARHGAGKQMRSRAGQGLAAPPARNGRPSPSRLPAGRSLPVQLWPPVEAPPTQTPPPAPTPPLAQTPPPVQTQPPVQAGRLNTGQAVPVQARPRPAARKTRKARRRGPRGAGVAALAVILTAAVAFALSSRSSARNAHGTQAQGLPSQRPQSRGPQSQSPTPQPTPPSKSAVTAGLASAWVATQVGHGVLVACDRAMCDALTAHGCPGRNLRLIRPGSSAPPHAQVLVVTPVVQREFGRSITTKWAPVALASFGDQGTSISARLEAPHGAARYEAALKADLQARKAHGAGLLNNPHVSAAATARKQLLTGQVDSRLIVVLTALGSRHPIRILDFGAAAPGTSAGIPLRIAHLAQGYAAAGMPTSAYVRFLSMQLNIEPGMYKPEFSGLGRDAAGTLTFQIKFPAPSPLGVLGTKGP